MLQVNEKVITAIAEGKMDSENARLLKVTLLSDLQMWWTHVCENECRLMLDFNPVWIVGLQ